MNTPRGLALDRSGRLYVADGGNNRVTTWNNATAKANGAAADNVLGGAGTTQNTMQEPHAVAVDSTGNRLIVADTNNRRTLQFAASSPLPVALVECSAE